MGVSDVIWIDDREPERNRYEFEGRVVETRRLEFGDYACDVGNQLIERKTYKDLTASLSSSKRMKTLLGFGNTDYDPHLIIEAPLTRILGCGEKFIYPKNVAVSLAQWLVRFSQDFGVQIWFAGNARQGNELAKIIL